MKYRIKRDAEGIGGVGEYHAFKTEPPDHTLGPGWETVDKLPQEVIDAEISAIEKGKLRNLLIESFLENQIAWEQMPDLIRQSLETVQALTDKVALLEEKIDATAK